MKGDLGEFIDYLGAYLAGAVKKDFKEVVEVMQYLGHKGIVLSLDVLKHTPLHLQFTIVFPESGSKKDRERLFAFFKSLAGLKSYKVKQTKRGERAVFEVKDGRFQAGWWQEGNHVVLVLGTEPLARILGVADGSRPNLTSTPLYKSVTSFKNYETVARGYVDLVHGVKVLQQPGKTLNQVEKLKEIAARKVIVTQFGLTGLKSLMFYAGFEGKAQRSTLILNLVPPAQRKALLRLVTASADFRPEQEFPPLPPDASVVSVHHLEWDTLYDAILQTARAYKQMQAFQANKLIPEPLPDIDALLGINLRKDLLAALDSPLVLYNSFSEGPLFLGLGVAVKVKNAKKLSATMNTLTTTLSKVVENIGGKVSVKKTTYRGADLFTLSGDGDLPLSPSYTVHKDWLVVGLFPQTVKGFIRRSEKKQAVWKMPSEAQKALLALEKKSEKRRLASLSVTDPRPILGRLLALAPLAARAVRLPEFDIAKIPHAQTVTEPLFPNVTVLVDEGDALRWESHSSLELSGGFVGGAIVAGLFAGL
jgi:hypothetical protein